MASKARELRNAIDEKRADLNATAPHGATEPNYARLSAAMAVEHAEQKLAAHCRKRLDARDERLRQERLAAGAPGATTGGEQSLGQDRGDLDERATLAVNGKRREGSDGVSDTDIGSMMAHL